MGAALQGPVNQASLPSGFLLIDDSRTLERMGRGIYFPVFMSGRFSQVFLLRDSLLFHTVFFYFLSLVTAPHPFRARDNRGNLVIPVVAILVIFTHST